MAEITAALVKELREITDAPMMECKKALTEAEGNIENAIDVLRKMGIAKAGKKAGRDTNEGAVATFVSDDGHKAGLVALYCETDFVGSNPKFQGFAQEIARTVAENAPTTEEDLKALTLDAATVEEGLTDLIHTMGENMKIGHFVATSIENGGIASYVHGGKIANLVTFSFTKPETYTNSAFQAFAHDVAMQVAASAPIAARREDVDTATIEHEINLYKEQAAESGKPEAIQEKMAQGRLEKFYKETVLTEQVFIKDSNKTIKQYQAETSKAVDDTIEIVAFDVLSIGA